MQPVAPHVELPLAEKLVWLRSAACYPGYEGPIEWVETHFAWVFFTHAYAFKLKKPVQIERLDFSTLAARHWNCLEELRLNRRLAPEVYLDVVPLARCEDGSLRLETAGPVVEWLVKMVRLDRTLMLDARLQTGALRARELNAAFELLGQFYRHQPRIELMPTLFRRRLEAQVERNRAALLDVELALPNREVRELTGLQLEFLADHHELFAKRAQGHVIVEGHGDLRPEHIFLGTPPCIIDCLEFDRDLRICDPVEEFAFLGIECARAGASWVGSFALDVYAGICGDRPAQALVEFYAAHRATSRAKVIAWHLRDPDYRTLAPWSDLALEYLRAARASLDRALHRATSAGSTSGTP